MSENVVLPLQGDDSYVFCSVDVRALPAIYEKVLYPC